MQAEALRTSPFLPVRDLFRMVLCLLAVGFRTSALRLHVHGEYPEPEGQLKADGGLRVSCLWSCGLRTRCMPGMDNQDRAR